MSEPLSNGEIYSECRRELIAVARTLTSSEAALPVPQCPAWSITDVVAHVAGISEDLLSGNTEGIGTEAWTQNQVDRCAGLGLEAVCMRWEGMNADLDAFMAERPVWALRATADLVTHLHDVLLPLGRSGDQQSDAVRLGLERYGPFFCERVADGGLPVVRIEAPDSDGVAWQSAEGSPAAILTGSAFELLRALSGRRSEAQIRAMSWTGDPDPYLAVVSPYGMPNEDIVE